MIAFAVFLILLISGHYISTVLFAAGIIGIYCLGGTQLLQGALTTIPYSSVASYTLSTVPLYILMAQFIMKAGIIEDLYSLVYKLSNGKKGPLGIMTIILGGFLGAVSGSGTATAAGLAKIATPELSRRGYSRPLSAAIAASSGSLSAIIPPSTMIVLYGVTAQVSVAELFMAAFVPGILMIVVYCIVTLFYLKFAKSHDTSAELVSEDKSMLMGGGKTRGQYIFVVCAGMLIILVIFGGIYSGLCTPSEAGALGAFIGLIAAIASGRMSFVFLIDSLVDAVKTTAMTMTMVVGAGVFARFITLSMLPKKIISALGPLMKTPTFLLFIVLAIYFILFMLLDGTTPILMTVPILLPLVLEAGYDAIWFGMLVAVSATVGIMTPPVGIAVYAVSGVTRIPSGQIFRITTVYAIAAAVVVGGLIIFFPRLVSWLPGLLL